MKIKQIVLCSAVAVFVLSNVLFAAPANVNIQIGTPPPPAPRVVVKETVVIKEKKDHGKHKGHYKQKKHKKHDD
jgi:hypothetical protein